MRPQWQAPGVVKAKFAWNSLFIAGDIFAVVRWIFKDGLTVNIQLGYPEYAAILAFCTSMLILTNWKWINRLRPSVQFSGLHPEIVRCRDEAAKLMQLKSFEPEKFALILELQYEFERLEIPTPMKDLRGLKTPVQFAAWKDALFVFFQKMVPLAKHRELKKARAYWKSA